MSVSALLDKDHCERDGYINPLEQLESPQVFTLNHILHKSRKQPLQQTLQDIKLL
jgi:hypothetical protein